MTSYFFINLIQRRKSFVSIRCDAEIQTENCVTLKIVHKNNKQFKRGELKSCGILNKAHVDSSTKCDFMTNILQGFH